MEKISGIVPSSRRVASVDLKSSPPIRPGTPSFGRPQGISTLAELNKPTTAELAIAKQKELADKRSLQEKNPVMVQDMADRFFMQKKKAAEPVKDFDLNIGWQAPVDRPEEPSVKLKLPADAAPPEVKTAAPQTAEDDEFYGMNADLIPAEEREFTPPGSYLDVVA